MAFLKIPSSLLLTEHESKRDPETQVVITKAKAAIGEWRKLDLSRTCWPTSLELMLRRGDHDVVLVAPKRDKKIPDLLAGLKLLREAGVAEKKLVQGVNKRMDIALWAMKEMTFGVLPLTPMH